eukprot:g78629.t1
MFSNDPVDQDFNRLPQRCPEARRTRLPFLGRAARPSSSSSANIEEQIVQTVEEVSGMRYFAVNAGIPNVREDARISLQFQTNNADVGSTSGGGHSNLQENGLHRVGGFTNSNNSHNAAAPDSPTYTHWHAGRNPPPVSQDCKGKDHEHVVHIAASPYRYKERGFNPLQVEKVGTVYQQSGLCFTFKQVPGTLSAFEETLSNGPKVLHISCHAVLNNNKEEAAFIFEQAWNTEPKPLTRQDLQDMARRNKESISRIDCVIIMSCHASRVAETFLSAGFRRVIFPTVATLLDGQAAKLSDELHKTLCRGKTYIDAVNATNKNNQELQLDIRTKEENNDDAPKSKDSDAPFASVPEGKFTNLSVEQHGKKLPEHPNCFKGTYSIDLLGRLGLDVDEFRLVCKLGAEGSGKSTLVTAVAHRMQAHRPVVLSKAEEPLTSATADQWCDKFLITDKFLQENKGQYWQQPVFILDDADKFLPNGKHNPCNSCDASNKERPICLPCFLEHLLEENDSLRIVLTAKTQIKFKNTDNVQQSALPTLKQHEAEFLFEQRVKSSLKGHAITEKEKTYIKGKQLEGKLPGDIVKMAEQFLEARDKSLQYSKRCLGALLLLLVLGVFFGTMVLWLPDKQHRDHQNKPDNQDPPSPSPARPKDLSKPQGGLVNECGAANGGCEHICIASLGSSTCFCLEGYVLDADGRRCSLSGGTEAGTQARRCGKSEEDAYWKCGPTVHCDSHYDCPEGEMCQPVWSYCSSSQGHVEPPRCGKDWEEADSKCGASCDPYSSGAKGCPEGELCLSSLRPCRNGTLSCSAAADREPSLAACRACDGSICMQGTCAAGYHTFKYIQGKVGRCFPCAQFAELELSLASCSDCDGKRCTNGTCATGYHSFAGGTCRQ